MAENNKKPNDVIDEQVQDNGQQAGDKPTTPPEPPKKGFIERWKENVKNAREAHPLAAKILDIVMIVLALFGVGAITYKVGKDQGVKIGEQIGKQLNEYPQPQIQNLPPVAQMEAIEQIAPAAEVIPEMPEEVIPEVPFS